MAKERSVFNNYLYKFIKLSSFRKIIFKVGASLSLFWSCKHSIRTCYDIKDGDSSEFFKMMKLTP